jgi:pyruvate dehydrogenase E1 component
VDQTLARVPADPAARERRRRRGILDQAFPASRAAALVTVLDGHPHTLAFLASVRRVPCVSLGVTSFGQSGALEDLYRYHGIDADSIVRAALDAAG